MASLLELWLDQPVWLVFALLALGFAALVGLIVLATNARRSRPVVSAFATGIVAPYFGSISVLLALLIGFVANDTWERQRQAARTVQTERANILAIHDLSIATVSDMHEIRRALLAYVDALLEDEWPKMTDGSSSPRAGAALSVLMRVVADPRHGAEAGAAAHATLLDAAMNLRAARGERLAISDAQGDPSKWLTLLILAGLTLTALGLTHQEKPRAQIVTLLLFSTAMVTTLGVIAIHERPFDGPLALQPAVIEAARAALVASPT